MSKVDLKMLATQLNVSVSTVSKALRDSHEIGAATKQRILEKAKELGYRPNPYASYMRQQKSKTIALIIPELNNSFFLQVINGAESIAVEKDYHLLVYITHEDVEKERSIIRHLQNGRVDGILMAISLTTTDYAHIEECILNDLPIVFFDRVCHEIETTKIVTDDFASAFVATEHLIKNSCKNIGYLSISDHLSIGIKRKNGYLEALNKYDIEGKEENIVCCSNNEKENYQKVKNLLCRPDKIDGILASVERFALTTYNVCKDMKINIPENLKVICFSNLYTADFLSPTLSTISQPAFEMGATAAETLLKHLEKKKMQLVNENIVIKSTLMIRESSTKRNVD
jgi:LacI family transcriptional regulator